MPGRLDSGDGGSGGSSDTTDDTTSPPDSTQTTDPDSSPPPRNPTGPGVNAGSSTADPPTSDPVTDTPEPPQTTDPTTSPPPRNPAGPGVNAGSSTADPPTSDPAGSTSEPPQTTEPATSPPPENPTGPGVNAGGSTADPPTAEPVGVDPTEAKTTQEIREQTPRANQSVSLGTTGLGTTGTQRSRIRERTPRASQSVSLGTTGVGTFRTTAEAAARENVEDELEAQGIDPDQVNVSVEETENGTYRATVEPTEEEQFGDAGLLPSPVEDAAQDVGEDISRTIDENVPRGALALGSVPIAAASTVSNDLAGDVARFHGGLFQGGAEVLNLPQTAVGVDEMVEFGVYGASRTLEGEGEEFASEAGSAGAAMAADFAEQAKENPFSFGGQLAGGLIASTATMGAGASVGGRLGTASRYAVQPGEELLFGAGRRAYSATRRAGSAGVDVGRTAAGRARQRVPSRQEVSERVSGLTPDQGDLVVDERSGDIFEVSESFLDRPAVTFVDEGGTPEFGSPARGDRPDMLRDPPETDIDGDGFDTRAESGADADADPAPATGGGAGDQLVFDLEVDNGGGQRTVMQARQRVRQPETESESEAQTQPEDTSIEVEPVRQPRVRAPPVEVEFAGEGLGLGTGQEFTFGPEGIFGTEFGAGLGTEFETEIGPETTQIPDVDTRVGPEHRLEPVVGTELSFGLEPAVDTRQDFWQEYRQEQRVETRTEVEQRVESEGRRFPDEGPFSLPGVDEPPARAPETEQFFNPIAGFSLFEGY